MEKTRASRKVAGATVNGTTGQKTGVGHKVVAMDHPLSSFILEILRTAPLRQTCSILLRQRTAAKVFWSATFQQNEKVGDPEDLGLLLCPKRRQCKLCSLVESTRSMGEF